MLVNINASFSFENILLFVSMTLNMLLFFFYQNKEWESTEKLLLNL